VGYSPALWCKRLGDGARPSSPCTVADTAAMAAAAYDAAASDPHELPASNSGGSERCEWESVHTMLSAGGWMFSAVLADMSLAADDSRSPAVECACGCPAPY
jgi:hypothetical protein